MTPTTEEPALLVVSYDGFHPDFLKRGVTPHLNKFREAGVFSPYMLNVNPTKTFINHYSIATVRTKNKKIQHFMIKIYNYS